MYNEVKKIQQMLWKNDDLLEQETLFDLQDYVGALLLKIAKSEDKTDDLLKSFPYMYKGSLKVVK